MAGATALRLDIEDELGVRASVRGKHVSGAKAPGLSAVVNVGTEVPTYPMPAISRTTSGAVRARVEAALARRIPGALTPQPKMVRPVVGTGIAAVDEAVGGGIPIGALTEVVGAECSGRTSLALSVVAQVMREGKVCAWVDVSDSLSPESAAAAGGDLARLLWVRCGVVREERQSAWAGFQVPEKYFVAPPPKKGLHGGGFGMHPRDEEKGMGDAVGGLLEPRCAEAVRKVRVGTSESVKAEIADAARNPDVKSTRNDEKQVSGANAPVQSGLGNAGTEVPAYQKESEVRMYPMRSFVRRKKHWDRMDQALRAMDLLLQTGGFGAVVLDLASMAPEHVSRIPLATWFRYRAAAERTQACVVLLTQYPCAKSSAELVLRMEKGMIRTQGGRVMTGFERRVEVVRRRFDGQNAPSVRQDKKHVSGAKAPVVYGGVHAGTEVPAYPVSPWSVGADAGGIGAKQNYRDPSPTAQDDTFKICGDGLNARGDVVGRKKPVQRAGVGVWESRPMWAVRR